MSTTAESIEAVNGSEERERAGTAYLNRLIDEQLEMYQAAFQPGMERTEENRALLTKQVKDMVNVLYDEHVKQEGRYVHFMRPTDVLVANLESTYAQVGWGSFRPIAVKPRGWEKQSIYTYNESYYSYLFLLTEKGRDYIDGYLDAMGLPSLYEKKSQQRRELRSQRGLLAA